MKSVHYAACAPTSKFNGTSKLPCETQAPTHHAGAGNDFQLPIAVDIHQGGRAVRVGAVGGGVGGQVQVRGPLHDARAQVECHQPAGDVLGPVHALRELLCVRLLGAEADRNQPSDTLQPGALQWHLPTQATHCLAVPGAGHQGWLEPKHS